MPDSHFLGKGNCISPGSEVIHIPSQLTTQKYQYQQPAENCAKQTNKKKVRMIYLAQLLAKILSQLRGFLGTIPSFLVQHYPAFTK